MVSLDMRDVVTTEKENLERYLKHQKKPFNGKEQKFIVSLMNFMYASSYCERTSDMREEFYAAQQYKNQAKVIYEQVAGKPME
jgi:hypothetical protein